MQVKIELTKYYNDGSTSTTIISTPDARTIDGLIIRATDEDVCFEATPEIAKAQFSLELIPPKSK
jgi:hypothetical protein